MEMWFSEIHTPNIKLTIERTGSCSAARANISRIDVFDSPELGKIVTLNGDIIFSDADEFVYDEMVTHVPMAVHPNVKKVLIIGGGDGGVAKELSYYPEIEEIEGGGAGRDVHGSLSEVFPGYAQGLQDPRVKIYHEDGLRFLRRRISEYDLIINDSTNPFGYTEGLFTKEFYGSCYKALKEDGIMVYQHGSPFYDEDEAACRSMHRKVFRSYPISRVYQAHITTCPAGYWLFGFASKKYHPIKDFDGARWRKRNIKTWYYTANLHIGAFMLPKYVEDLLEEEEGKL